MSIFPINGITDAKERVMNNRFMKFIKTILALREPNAKP